MFVSSLYFLTFFPLKSIGLNPLRFSLIYDLHKSPVVCDDVALDPAEAGAESDSHRPVEAIHSSRPPNDCLPNTPLEFVASMGSFSCSWVQSTIKQLALLPLFIVGEMEERERSVV